MGYQGIDNRIDGWMLWDELEWLYDRASESVNVLEVGSWMGRSIHALLSGCKGTVYAVDHFKGSASEIETVHIRAKYEDIHKIFMDNVGHFKNLAVLKMDSVEASKLFGPKWFDMIFIDGDHEYDQVRKDIECWMPKCKKLLCGHDVNEGGVYHVLKDLGLEYSVVVGSIWKVDL